MLFNSIDFMFFFPVVTILYYLLPHTLRKYLLLSASILFYMAFIPKYIIILSITIIIDYVAAILIERDKGKWKQFYLIVSIVSTCAVLIIFKYYNFFNDNLNFLFQVFHIDYTSSNLNLILPIGLSFHTFQSLSYVIEVYKKNQKAEKHFIIYALYVMFYPQLVAGPIERPNNLLHQFYTYHPFNSKNIVNGLYLMMWGFFKKVIIADRAAMVVNTIYANPHDFSGLQLLLATYLFAFQIYCDFSGYSDIARGAARVMGFELMKNFDNPYSSKSISEFWRRWHISLSSWFKDYIYIPLGGSKVRNMKWIFNIMITFILSGLWHGANWTFIIWGFLNGLFIAIERFTISKIDAKNTNTFIKFIKILLTFNLITLTWIFFRANNLSDATFIVGQLFKTITLHTIFNNIGIEKSGLAICLFMILLLEAIQYLQKRANVFNILSNITFFKKTIFFTAYILFFEIFGVFTNSSQFIYFQF